MPKKDRMVPVRIVGEPDRKPRHLVPFALLGVFAATSPMAQRGEVEWFNQPARKWERITTNAK